MPRPDQGARDQMAIERFAEAVAADGRRPKYFPYPSEQVHLNPLTWLAPNVAVSRDQSLIWYGGNVYQIRY